MLFDTEFLQDVPPAGASEDLTKDHPLADLSWLMIKISQWARCWPGWGSSGGSRCAVGRSASLGVLGAFRPGTGSVGSTGVWGRAIRVPGPGALSKGWQASARCRAPAGSCAAAEATRTATVTGRGS
jgi:hypothetical protein